MGISGYTSVTIHGEKYKKIRADFDKHIKDKIDRTFTGWVTDLMENSIDRAVKVKAMFPHLAVVKVLEHGLIIEDLKNDAVVKVVIKDKKLVCTDSSEKAQQYILYASLHPQFWI